MISVIKQVVEFKIKILNNGTWFTFLSPFTGTDSFDRILYTCLIILNRFLHFTRYFAYMRLEKSPVIYTLHRNWIQWNIKYNAADARLKRRKILIRLKPYFTTRLHLNFNNLCAVPVNCYFLTFHNQKAYSLRYLYGTIGVHTKQPTQTCTLT